MICRAHLSSKKYVLGFAKRSAAFRFPRAWMGCSTPNGELVIHIWSGGPGWADRGSAHGTATIDHVSLAAVGHRGFRDRFQRFKLPWEFVIPNTTLFQMFVYDPSGVQIRLTFDLNAEPSYDTNIAPEHRYSATGGGVL
jgi:hypothetical protein